MRALGCILLGSVFSIAACGPAEDGGANFVDAGNGDDANPNSDGNVIPPMPEQCNKMDIVFVIDDSGSMGEEQANLAANFPVFAQVLEDFRTESGQELDYRLAITTTGRDVDYVIDVPPPPPPFPPLDPPPIPMSESGDNGAFLYRPECNMTRRWFERTDPDVRSNFACAAEVGTGGPSIEMPLLMLEWALSDRVADGTNAGFLREDALLGVVVLTDENDCSRADNDFVIENDQDLCDDSEPEIIGVASFISFLDTLKLQRGRWATAVIAGPGPGTCSTVSGDAIEATRLKDFVAETGENAVFSSICQPDLASALADAIAKFDAACRAFPPIE
jgi:hypothetical protein